MWLKSENKTQLCGAILDNLRIKAILDSTLNDWNVILNIKLGLYIPCNLKTKLNQF